jgi:SM-20-related protein
VFSNPAASHVPFLVQHEFLDPDSVSGLLKFAVSNESRFKPCTVGAGKVGSKRVALCLRELGSFEHELSDKVLSLAPVLISQLGVNAFEPSSVEIELVAHGDGAFYRMHTDTDAGEIRKDRIISGVYYFYAQPRAFAGGALRLYDIRSMNFSQYVDIEPTHNAFVAFPSWMPHEVMPVSCRSRMFGNSRFAVNCWLWRKRPSLKP